MINKKNLWFLTLFSLVLVLSIYYVTMPSEILDNSLSKETTEKSNVEIQESSLVSSLKVEDDTNVKEKINEMKSKLSDTTVNTEDKNNYFEELKLISKNSSKEETLEVKIKELCSCDNFVKIDGDNVKVVLDSKDANTTKANEIMKTVQSEFDDKMYISVKFN